MNSSAHGQTHSALSLWLMRRQALAEVAAMECPSFDALSRLDTIEWALASSRPRDTADVLALIDFAHTEARNQQDGNGLLLAALSSAWAGLGGDSGHIVNAALTGVRSKRKKSTRR